jgi:hypothetical protein
MYAPVFLPLPNLGKHVFCSEINHNQQAKDHGQVSGHLFACCEAITSHLKICYRGTPLERSTRGQYKLVDPLWTENDWSYPPEPRRISLQASNLMMMEVILAVRTFPRTSFFVFYILLFSMRLAIARNIQQAQPIM